MLKSEIVKIYCKNRKIWLDMYNRSRVTLRLYLKQNFWIKAAVGACYY